MLTLLIAVSTVIVFIRFFGAFRSEIAEAKLADEYWNYFYETYELPAEPMFPNASAPLEILGNRTRNMLRDLLAAQEEADNAEKEHQESGSWSLSSYRSEAEYRKALERIEKMKQSYQRLAELYQRVPDDYLPNLRVIATDTSAERFYHQQEMFHLAEVEIVKREAKLVSDIAALLRERAKLLWANRSHLEEGRNGTARPKATAPRDLRPKLDAMDGLLDEKYAEWEDLERDHRAAFNKFYYTITGQRQDEFND